VAQLHFFRVITLFEYNSAHCSSRFELCLLTWLRLNGQTGGQMDGWTDGRLSRTVDSMAKQKFVVRVCCVCLARGSSFGRLVFDQPQYNRSVMPPPAPRPTTPAQHHHPAPSYFIAFKVEKIMRLVLVCTHNSAGG